MRAKWGVPTTLTTSLNSTVKRNITADTVGSGTGFESCRGDGWGGDIDDHWSSAAGNAGDVPRLISHLDVDVVSASS